MVAAFLRPGPFCFGAENFAARMMTGLKIFGGTMRQAFCIGKAGLALILCVLVLFTGCSTAWVGQAEEIVAALIPAAANLVTLVAALQGKSVSAADLQTIENAGTQVGADLQLIQSLVAQYEKADAAAQPGILNQIESAVNTAQANLNGILPAIHIKDAATQAKISAVVGILLSEVSSLAAVVPLVRAGGVGGVKSQNQHQNQSQNPHPVAQNATR